MPEYQTDRLQPSVIRPQPGFQEDVLSSPADITISGGAAGCGKSWCSVAEPLKYVHLTGFSAVIFRRTYPELVGGGSVWELSTKLYRAAGGIPREGCLDWRFPSGALVKFSHLQHEKNIYEHQSKEYSLVIFEEVTHFTEHQFWYLMSRLRSMCKVKPYIRATCNPDPNSFISKLVSWWIDEEGFPIQERSGVLRYMINRDGKVIFGEKEELEKKYNTEALSITFIPGKLSDNQILLNEDPQYEFKLDNLPYVERQRLRYGNWRVVPAAGLYFKRSYFPIVDRVDPAQIEECRRFWDKAATEAIDGKDPSWTVGAKMARLLDGSYVIMHIERFRGSTKTVDESMQNIARQDGVEVTQTIFQDPGQAGVVDREHTRRILDGFHFEYLRATKDKITMAGPLSAQAEGGNVKLLRGNWNEDFLFEAEAFPKIKHKDQIDAASGAYHELQGTRLIYR